MLATIWTCTHEWSLISIRATAFTFATCHQPLSWRSAFARSITVRSLRLPRAGTLMRICATASTGVSRVSRSASAETGCSIRSSVFGSRSTEVTLDPRENEPPVDGGDRGLLRLGRVQDEVTVDEDAPGSGRRSREAALARLDEGVRRPEGRRAAHTVPRAHEAAVEPHAEIRPRAHREAGAQTGRAARAVALRRRGDAVRARAGRARLAVERSGHAGEEVEAQDRQSLRADRERRAAAARAGDGLDVAVGAA